MQVHLLPHSAGPNDSRAMAGIIRSIGRSTFAADLFATVHAMVQADHVTAFSVAPGKGIRTVLTENSGPVPVAREVAQRYVRHYWTCDPVERMLVEAKTPEAAEKGCMVVSIDSADVEHAAYRADCYLSVDLHHRLSVANALKGTTMRLNRRRGHDFSQEDVGRVISFADLLLATVRRHDDTDIAANVAELEAIIIQRIARSAPTLTERERQVCAMVALGLTSEGIALRLNISLNTVVTYRKRAYARLSISSQNELMRRLLN
jgi:DNA-binding CsgD family transcriptional regulator